MLFWKKRPEPAFRVGEIVEVVDCSPNQEKPPRVVRSAVIRARRLVKEKKAWVWIYEGPVIMAMIDDYSHLMPMKVERYCDCFSEEQLRGMPNGRKGLDR